MVKKVAHVAVAPDDVGGAQESSARSTNIAHRQVLWLNRPQLHDYPAAQSYLSLLAGPKRIRTVVAALKQAPLTYFKAKDILRACGLPLLPPENPHVAADLVNIADGAPLSPCLLVRGALSRGRPAQIADGYHRVCASYHTDENTDIPVKIATL